MKQKCILAAMLFVVLTAWSWQGECQFLYPTTITTLGVAECNENSPIQECLWGLEADCEYGDYAACYSLQNSVSWLGDHANGYKTFLWALHRSYELCETQCYSGETSACVLFGYLVFRNDGGIGCFVRDGRSECLVLALEMAMYACRVGDVQGCLRVAFALLDGWLGESMCVEAAEMFRLCCDASRGEVGCYFANRLNDCRRGAVIGILRPF